MKLITKWLALLLIFMAASSLFGCKRGDNPTGSAAPVAPPALSAMISRGEMRVAYVSWSPAVIKDAKTGTLTGIFPDMINHMADLLKVKVTWNETTLANFAAGLQSGQYDFSVGPTFITIPRAVAVAFTQPVAYVGNSAVVRRDTRLPSSVQDIADRKMKVAVLQGQAMDEYFKRRYPNVPLLTLSGGDLTAPLAAVSAGQADIGFMNTVTVTQYVGAHPETKAVFVGEQQLEMLPLAWATRHEDQSLRDFLESSITYLKATGRLEEIQRKYPIQLLYDTPTLHSAKH